MKSRSRSKKTDWCGVGTHGQTAADKVTKTKPPRSEKRILLVDDDVTVRESLGNVLESEGYVVIPAENGAQALDLARQAAVDLVLLDLNMPVKNGWDTFELHTREHPFIPIIILTARPHQLFTAMSAGAAALMEKPMDIHALLLTVEELLEEPAAKRLERLAGRNTHFNYQPALGRDGK